MFGCGRSEGDSVAPRQSRAALPPGKDVLLNTELCVVFHDFINIDLFSQGWYAIRVRLLSKAFSTPWPCRALSLDTGPNSNSWAGTPSAPVNTGTKLAAPSEVEAGGQSFRSKVFLIKYCHEQVHMDEVVCFHLTTDMWAGAEGSTATMDVELLFQELDKQNLNRVPSTLDLKMVARRTLSIHCPARGIHEFLSVGFDVANLACAKMSVHSALLGFSHGSRASRTAQASSGGAPTTPRPQCRGSYFETQEEESAAGRDENDAQTPDATQHTNLNSNTLLTLGDSPGRHTLPALELSPSPSVSPQNSPKPKKIPGLAPPVWQSITPTPQRVAVDQYFPPIMGEDLTLIDVGPAHPVVTILDGSTVQQRSGSSGLAKRLASASHDPRGRAETLHRWVNGTLLDSYNLLVAQLQALPLAVYAPQSLDTLRMVMLPEASKLSMSLSDLTKQSTLGRDSPNVIGLSSQFRGRRNGIKLPSLELGSMSEAADRLMPGSMRKITSEFIGLTGQEIGLARAIEEGHMLGYKGPQNYLASLPTNFGPESAAEHLLEELGQIQVGVLANWACLLWVARHANGQMGQAAERLWQEKRRAEWAPWVLESQPGGESETPKDPLQRQSPSMLGLRSSFKQTNMDTQTARIDYRQVLKNLRGMPMPRVQENHVYLRPHHNPVLYMDESLARELPEDLISEDRPQDLCAVYTAKLRPPRKVHVVVFVHGFQGTSADMRLVRGHMQVLNPKLACLMSKCNEGRTYDALEAMGERLASEVLEYLSQFHDQTVRKRKVLWRLSFVGHSIGNLIIRTALMDERLRQYHGFLWLYMSISGPHLGYLYSSNRLFDSGLWVLKSCRNIRCLHQLTFSDSSRVEDCFLYRLAMAKGLSLFRQVIILSSVQDRYVPFQSARIEMCPAARKDKKRGHAYQAMVKSLTEHFGNGPNQIRVLRADIDFYQQAKQQWTNFDHIVGRRAHIEFIETDTYVRFLLWTVFRDRDLLSDAEKVRRASSVAIY